jgi:bifunctional polynucleotide phosphatase/kinase
MVALAAVDDDEYRKPCGGMWDYFRDNLNDGNTINIKKSMYIGDAAGRPARGNRKKDFNDTDLKFAINIGVKFETPEKFFLGEKDRVVKPKFDPKAILK